MLVVSDGRCVQPTYGEWRQAGEQGKGIGSMDIGKLTQEQTADLLQQCINALPWALIADTLNQALTTEQKEELGGSWFNMDKEA